MIESKNSLVFETKNATLHQCDDSERYVLRFFDQAITLHPCELIAFRRKINAVDIVSLFDSNRPDVELISLPSCDRLFVFSIREILELKELVHGSFAMLELNSMIHRQLYRIAI